MSERDADRVRQCLAALRSAVRVQRLQPAGSTRAQRRRVGDVVNARLLEAVEAGATLEQAAHVVGLAVDTVRQRLRHARLQAADRFPDPDTRENTDAVGGVEQVDEVLVALAPAPKTAAAKSAWRDIRACHRPAPPPWPVSARCRAPHNHEGEHDFSHARHRGRGPRSE